MEMGMIGLGKMGSNMVKRLLGRNHRLITYDIAEEAVRETVKEGAVGATSVSEMATLLGAPRAV